MFTQKISMDCTKEQYEKYLKKELLKMGYNEYSTSRWHNKENEYLTNSYGGLTGDMGNINYASKNLYECVYLGKFNAPLFLALAAMTDKIGGGYREYYIQGSYMLPMNEKGFLGKDGVWCKATVSEIMAKFGEQPQKDIYITLAFEKEPIWENCEKDIEEYEAIHLLKSKGYKIFKQTTTLEEV